jgi:hypothetical protein
MPSLPSLAGGVMILLSGYLVIHDASKKRNMVQ